MCPSPAENSPMPAQTAASMIKRRLRTSWLPPRPTTASSGPKIFGSVASASVQRKTPWARHEEDARELKECSEVAKDEDEEGDRS